MRNENLSASRRAFLKGAAAAGTAFVMGTWLPFGQEARAQQGLPPGPFDPNVFLKIGQDNLITLQCKFFEMGQGVATGCATLVAEELGADWAAMRIEFAPSDAKLYNNLVFGPVQGTGGSTSTMGSFVQMRQIGAAARVMFTAAAAARWNVPAGEVVIEKSIVRHGRSNRQAGFGELAADAMRQPVPAQVTLKDPKDWVLIGTKLPRIDSPAKTNGTATFGMDIKRPGMVTAVLRRPDKFGGKVGSFDATATRAIPGVIDVVQVPQGIAVIARDTWTAMRGRQALKITWDDSQAEDRSTDAIFATYRELVKGKGLEAERKGDAPAKLAGAAKVYEAEFTFPFLAHSPMEPLNGVMELTADGADIWSGSQLQTIDQFVAAQVLGFKPEQVRVHTQFGGGSFGRRGNPVGDFAGELAAVTKAYGKAPVHLVWTREDDIRGGFYRAMVLHRVKVGLDGQGKLSGWEHKIATKSIFAGTPFAPMAIKNDVDASSVEGVVESAYNLPDITVDSYNVTSPIPVLWYRSVGHSHTAHVMETAVDELAHMGGQDPVEFRAGLLAGKPRDLAVLRLAAEKAGWSTPLPRGRGRGVAYHFSFGARVAMVAEVTVDGASIKVDKIVAAVDCGVAVNPDVVAAQIQGAIGFSLSAALRNQITLAKGVVQQGNFDDYEPTRMREMPQVEVHIVPSRENPSGIGEPGVPPVAPAVGNAIFAATGKRLRSLPLALGTLV